MRKHWVVIEEQIKKLADQKNLTQEIELMVTSLKVACSLDSLDWIGKPDIIRRLVKKIEISDEEINIVYKVNKLSEPENSPSRQHFVTGSSVLSRSWLKQFSRSTHQYRAFRF